MKSSHWITRLAVAGLFAVALVAVPAIAHAQIGTLAGKVVGPDGKPVEGALIVFDNPAQGQHLEAKTNKKGEWTVPGMMLGGGDGAWHGLVKMSGFADAKIQILQIRMNSVTDTPVVTLSPAKAGMNLGTPADQAKKAAIDKAAADATAAFDAKDYDTAIAKLTEAAGLVDKCSICYTKIGDAYMAKKDNPDAETAYLKAIDLDPNSPDPYDALSNVYNQMRKYDDAAKMATKASDLKSAKSGGVVDPDSEYNAAVIAFNQSKIPEARTHLEKVLQLKPDHAEAHYYMGMVLINQNKIPDAKKELQKYLELAPTGPNADMAKAILATP